MVEALFARTLVDKKRYTPECLSNTVARISSTFRGKHRDVLAILVSNTLPLSGLHNASRRVMITRMRSTGLSSRLFQLPWFAFAMYHWQGSCLRD